MENNGFNILVVDDSMVNQAVLSNILTMAHVDVTGAPHTPFIIDIAKSGPEALEKMNVRKPDLILLDIVMPGMSGFDVLAKLKDSEATKSIPVIIITGLSDVENEEKGLLLGAVDYIAKPFNKAVVLARIRTHQKIVEQMRMIERYALYDPLTNVLNRRSFEFLIENIWGNAIRRKDSISAMMIDIDDFKRHNDIYGHQHGDVTLQMVASAISSSLRRTSDLLFRWGGEEFVTLLPNTPMSGAVEVAENMRVNIENIMIPSIHGEVPPKVTASIGVASVIPDASSVVLELITRADKAMYAAKETGKNRVCTTDDI